MKDIEKYRLACSHGELHALVRLEKLGRFCPSCGIEVDCPPPSPNAALAAGERLQTRYRSQDMHLESAQGRAASPPAVATGASSMKSGQAAPPWGMGREDVVVGFALRLPEALKLKLAWVAASAAGRVSQHTIILSAIERELDRLIEQAAMK